MLRSSIIVGLGVAAIGLSVIWMGPRPVQELWMTEELAEELAGGLETRAPPHHPLSAHSEVAPALGVIDLDRDGDDDLIHLDRERGRLRYYRNKGPEGLALVEPFGTPPDAALRPDSDLSGHRRGLRWKDVEGCGTLDESILPAGARRGLFFDADNDGDLDVVLILRVDDAQAETSRLQFFMRLESGYREITARLGRAFARERQISDLACGDFNADGLLDLALARPSQPPIVLWNFFTSRHYLGLYLRSVPAPEAAPSDGKEERRDIVVNVRGNTVLRRCLVSSGNVNVRYVHIGLGELAGALEIEITWAGGATSLIGDLMVNCVYEVAEGADEARLLRGGQEE